MMHKITYLFLPVFFLFAANRACAQEEPDTAKTNYTGLINETMLHPGDAFTGYTLKKGEIGVYKSISLLPVDWIRYGITDRLTVHLDFWNWIYKIPSLNFRFALAEQKGLFPALAFETMYLHIPYEEDIFIETVPLHLIKSGHSWYNRFNASWRLTDKFRFHLSSGVTYSQHLIIGNRDSINYKGKEYFDLISPDISAGIDWRPKEWISLFVNTSYGSTFAFIDNIPQKQQVVISTRLVPFVNSRHAFFRTMRIEISLLSMYFKDADVHLKGPDAYIYWQWKHIKKQKLKK